MDATIPSVGFDQGEEPKVPYVKLGLLALIGVMATVVLMSMILKPKYYAKLMGAKIDQNIASQDRLTYVSSKVDDDKTASSSAIPSVLKQDVGCSLSNTPTLSPTITPR